MTKFACVLTFLAVFLCVDARAYEYAYRPHEKKITVYGFPAKEFKVIDAAGRESN